MSCSSCGNFDYHEPNCPGQSTTTTTLEPPIVCEDPNPCAEVVPLSCVVYEGETINCYGLEHGMNMEQILQNLLSELYPNCSTTTTTTTLPPVSTTTSTTTTSTSTTSTTTLEPCTNCETFDVGNPTRSIVTVNYTDCDNLSRSVQIGINQTVRICVCNTEIAYPSGVTVTLVGSGCIPATTTTTSSTTTTTTQPSCMDYTVTAIADGTFEYIDCAGVSQSIEMVSGDTLLICALSYGVYPSRQFSIAQNGDCTTTTSSTTSTTTVAPIVPCCSTVTNIPNVTETVTVNGVDVTVTSDVPSTLDVFNPVSEVNAPCIAPYIPNTLKMGAHATGDTSSQFTLNFDQPVSSVKIRIVDFSSIYILDSTSYPAYPYPHLDYQEQFTLTIDDRDAAIIDCGGCFYDITDNVISCLIDNVGAVGGAINGTGVFTIGDGLPFNSLTIAGLVNGTNLPNRSLDTWFEICEIVPVSGSTTTTTVAPPAPGYLNPTCCPDFQGIPNIGDSLTINGVTMSVSSDDASNLYFLSGGSTLEPACVPPYVPNTLGMGYGFTGVTSADFTLTFSQPVNNVKLRLVNFSYNYNLNVYTHDGPNTLHLEYQEKATFTVDGDPATISVCDACQYDIQENSVLCVPSNPFATIANGSGIFVISSDTDFTTLRIDGSINGLNCGNSSLGLWFEICNFDVETTTTTTTSTSTTTTTTEAPVNDFYYAEKFICGGDGTAVDANIPVYFPTGTVVNLTKYYNSYTDPGTVTYKITGGAPAQTALEMNPFGFTFINQACTIT